MARIYVIEDDETVRTQLAELLATNGHDVTCATRFDALVSDALAAHPDLILLDLGLPGTDGQYFAREFRKRSDIPIVVLTSRTTELDELMSMSRGADAFIAKPYNGQILLAHIDAILRRAMPSAQASRTIEVGDVTLNLSQSRASAAGHDVELTKNEVRILEILMRNAPNIVSRQDIMQALWQSDEFIDDNTLTVNVNRLRTSLARIGVTDYIVTHRGLGYAIQRA